VTRKEAMEGFTTELLAGEGWQATLGALAVDGPATHSFVLKYTTPAPCRFDEERPSTAAKAFAWSRQPNGPSHSQGLSKHGGGGATSTWRFFHG
jgi:hypothetical protein